jgi:putative DNA primase/helicase
MEEAAPNTISIAERIEANAPSSLKAIPQWVLWQYKRVGDALKKPPYTPTGQRAAVDNPITWSSYNRALATLRSNNAPYNGLGFILTGGIVAIDLDHCLSNTGVLTRTAQEVLHIANSYSEISPSGTGLHIFLRGTLPKAGTKRGSAEMYESRRYITITGERYGEADEIRSNQEAIKSIYHLLFPTPTEAHTAQQRETPRTTTPRSDNQVIEKAIAARNGEKFKRLYKGDIRGYPSKSEADLAFIAMLAYWTDDDPLQMDRLFRTSGLFTEAAARKWDEQHAQGFTYGQITIIKAIRSHTRY